MTDPTEQPTNVIAALSRVMAELPGIGKDQVSPQGYQYRGIEQITQHAQPLFAKHGVVFAPQRVEWRETVNITINGRPWVDEKLVVHYRVYGPGGIDDFIDVEAPATGRDNADKGTSKAMTMAYKYALLQTLCIADAKDDADNAAAAAADAYDPEAPSSVATRERMQTIRQLCAQLREAGHEVTEQNDEAEVSVLDRVILMRNAEHALVPAIDNAAADGLIVTLHDAVLQLTAPAPEPGPEVPREPATQSTPEAAASAPAASMAPAAPEPPAEAQTATESPTAEVPEHVEDIAARVATDVAGMKLGEVRAACVEREIALEGTPNALRQRLIDALVTEAMAKGGVLL